MSSSESDLSEIITIPVERYIKLEKLEQSLPNMIQEAIQEYKKNSLKRLHERDKENPEGVKKRVQRYIEKNRDKINQRRRDKRKEQKRILEATVRQSTNALIIDMFGKNNTENFKVTSVKEPRSHSIPFNAPYIVSNDITVRFDD